MIALPYLMVAPKIHNMIYDPKHDKQTKRFLENIKDISDNQKEILVSESLKVINAAGTPKPGRQNVGLVVGYVQSGKTMSLTCVSSLARDKGYAHIIILCGVTNELFSQNMNRVQDDLIKQSDMAFLSKANPKKTESDYYRGKFRLFKLSNGKNATVVTFLLKHANHINNLASILETIGSDGNDIPTLIIDDEAHMAGLNTNFTKKEESNIYKALKNLRSKISDYAYLQYTATPQAPLLVHLADCVSPEFAVVLTPGEAYAGGRTFFPLENPNKDLIIDIPKGELPESTDADLPISPPASFKQALWQFLVGVADNLAKDRRDSVRSMLIHPHKLTSWHWLYKEFTQSCLKFAQDTLLADDAGDKAALIKEFNRAYKELSRTFQSISKFDDIIVSLPEAIEHAKSGIVVVNATNKEKIQWNIANILIGGEILGVGFTVKGLTISYMLRTSPNGQIDSMQQRARFFGYRGQDLKLTRVYLSEETHAAFRDYVKHEEETRNELQKMQKAGKSLKKWRRHFLIRAGMQLTRKNIQSLITLRTAESKINYPSKPYFNFEENNSEHLKLLDDITNNWGLEVDPACRPEWTGGQKHLSSNIDADRVLEDVLSKFSWSDPDDAASWDSSFYLLKLIIEEAKKTGNQPKPIFKLMVMRPSERGKSFRGVTNGTWELLQGRNPDGGYPGDKGMADPDITTIQLHCYTFKDGRKGSILGKDIVVPIIIPAKSIEREMERIIQQ
jgi:Z1 domain